MNSVLLGGLLGLMLAVGVIIAVRASPPMRPIRLADRVAPYLGDTPAPSKLLARPTATSAPFTVLRRLFGPALGDAVGLLDRVVGGRASVRRRLAGLSSRMTVEEFRLEQVVWGTFAMIASALLVVGVGVLRGDVNVLLAIGAAIIGLITGVLARDWAQSRQLRRREAAMLAEFPVVADLLALAVVAGEAPGNALMRVSRLTGGELARDIDRRCPRRGRAHRLPEPSRRCPIGRRWSRSPDSCKDSWSRSSAALRWRTCCVPKPLTSERPASALFSRRADAKKSR